MIFTNIDGEDFQRQVTICRYEMMCDHLAAFHFGEDFTALIQTAHNYLAGGKAEKMPETTRLAKATSKDLSALAPKQREEIRTEYSQAKLDSQAIKDQMRLEQLAPKVIAAVREGQHWREISRKLHLEEFLSADTDESPDRIIPPGDKDKLDFRNYTTAREYTQKQVALWFEHVIENFESTDWRLWLGNVLPRCFFLRGLLTVLQARTISLDEIIQGQDNILPEFTLNGSNENYKRNLLYSFIALISEARVREGEKISPFLDVRVHLWIRELRRLVAFDQL